MFLFFSFENKQTGVQENLDICCEKIGAVIETQATTAKKMKSTTDVKSKLSLLTDMTESLINRLLE